MSKHAISPTRSENYSGWYQSVIQAAELAESAPVRGCMVIRPWGYGIWERIQYALDTRIKQLGHENIYCPLFIPLSFLEKEAAHVEGFAKECAVVTHSKLQQSADGSLVPAGKLEEPLIVRPTSETIIGELFARWMQSYRDFPLLTNQWANIVRWEMRTRLFLRTTEFLWQEGHTAHTTGEEANNHTLTMLGMYTDFCTEHLALPVFPGEKSKNETFPGAENTYTIEAIMQDHKALQLGTSHFLGQNFASASNMQYQDEHGNMQTPWTTSWGVTTRLIGGLIMSHSDDDGLVLPPRVAPYQCVIIPILGRKGEHDRIMAYCQAIAKRLSSILHHHEPIRAKVDQQHLNGGEKNWYWIKRGAPIRIHIGYSEWQKQTVCYSLRSKPHKEKTNCSLDAFIESCPNILTDAHAYLFQQASERSMANIPLYDSIEHVHAHFATSSRPVFVYWLDHDAHEKDMQQRFGISIRCYPFPHPTITHHLSGPCVFDNNAQGRLALVAKAY